MDNMEKKYRVVLYGMGAAIPEVYELNTYEAAKQMFFQSTDGICYRKAFIVEHGPHASWRVTDSWGYSDGPLREVAHG